jgi:two-component system OmpR family sensor kinase
VTTFLRTFRKGDAVSTAANDRAREAAPEITDPAAAAPDVDSSVAYAPPVERVPTEALEVGAEARRSPFGLRTTRSRLVASYLVLLVVTGALATFALRELLVIRLDDRISDDLQQEISEVRRLVLGIDPDTGESFDSLSRVYNVFFRRNVPSEDEALVGFVGTDVHDQDLTRFPLETLPDTALNDWRAFSRNATPGDEDTGTFPTAEGTMKFRAIQLRAGTNEGERGAFVVAILPVTERAEIRELQFYAAVIAVLVVLIAAGAAWFLAGRVLAPVNELTETARTISESELTRRLRVRGTDEVANMARTFNAMLDRLEAVYRSQREFLRAAGHEFRTPLTVATGHLELLSNGTTSEEEREATVALVLDELRRMGRITDDLQALAESERADFLAPQRLDLREFADQLITKASALGHRNWQLDQIADGPLVADGARITQAVLNLADNAVKNTEEGDTIAIGVANRGPEVHIWVRDAGVGIPDEDKGRILERFERGSTAGKRYRGAGLGLAIVNTVAEAHGGRVTVESRLGAGSRFTIILPREG